MSHLYKVVYLIFSISEMRTVEVSALVDSEGLTEIRRCAEQILSVTQTTID